MFCLKNTDWGEHYLGHLLPVLGCLGGSPGCAFKSSVLLMRPLEAADDGHVLGISPPSLEPWLELGHSDFSLALPWLWAAGE